MSQRSQNVRILIQQAIEQHTFPGCVVGIINREGQREFIAAGRHTYEPESPAVADNTVYDVASVTKSIPTSSALLTLVEAGRLSLEDPVVKFIPEFDTHESKRSVLVRHLLTYSLDLGALSLSGLVQAGKSAREILETICSAPLARPPGERYIYANATGLLTGLLVERVSGRKLPDFARELFFGPLNMSDTTFRPAVVPLERIAPTGFQGGRGWIHGVVHDPGTFVLQPTYALGSAGLFSTVPDLLHFLQMLLHTGSINGRQFFKPETVSLMYTNQLASVGFFQGLGWQLNDPRWMGSLTHPLFGKTGFTGCMVLVDPIRGHGIVALSNRTFPYTPSDYVLIHTFWRRLVSLVLQ